MRTSTSTLRATAALLLAGMLASAGCIAGAVGAIGQQIERGKKLDVPAAYDGLEGKTCAVIVNADYATLVEHPAVVKNITANVSARIAQYVKDATVLPPATVLSWQYRTPQWRAMPYGDIAKELGVERHRHLRVPAQPSWQCVALGGRCGRQRHDHRD